MEYIEVDMGGGVTGFLPKDWEPAGQLQPQLYAEARAGMGMVCTDVLPAGILDDGTPVVILINRSSQGEFAGPFRGEPWVVGGKWPWSYTYAEGVLPKLEVELFGGRDMTGKIVIHDKKSIGGRQYVTGWASGEDGPLGLPGATQQPCFLAEIEGVLQLGMIRPDKDHKGYKLITPDDPLDDLHPYVRTVIQKSGWLTQDVEKQRRRKSGMRWLRQPWLASGFRSLARVFE